MFGARSLAAWVVKRSLLGKGPRFYASTLCIAVAHRGARPGHGTHEQRGQTFLYTGPITIASTSTLKFVAFDLAGNVSAIGERAYTITNTPTPDAPAFGTPTVGAGQVTLTWTATDPSITGYGVQVFDSAGTAVGSLRETTGTTMTITGLTGDANYFFTVQAKNVNGYGPASDRLGPATPQGSVVANAGPDRAGVARNTTVTLNGAGSTTPATYAWTQLATGTGNPIAATDP